MMLLSQFLLAALEGSVIATCGWSNVFLTSQILPVSYVPPHRAEANSPAGQVLA